VKTVALANELDSINYIFGYLNGFDINRYVLANSDDKVADQKELIANVNKGLSSNVSNPQLVNVATNFGQQLKTMNDNGLMNMPQLELNYKLLRQGLINGFLKDTVVWQSAEANTYLRQTMTSLESRQAKEDAKDRIAQEEAFLAQNAQRPEVTVTESGLQYEVLKKGKGALPKLTDVVKVHYHGTLLDGTVFDSSVDRKEPISFGVTQVIPGWTEALQLMPVGSKYKLYIPYQLGYNDRPAGKIPPYSMLIFEVELLSIEKQ
jgi:FKBP-type peptidyl-prolyl cis-trans isomerase FklB